MKKFLTLISGLVFAMCLSAQVGYLIPYTADVNYGSIGNVYDYLPQENSGSVEESPERKSYEWFNGVYTNAAGKQFFTVKDIKDGALLSAGVPTVAALWINVDRVGYSLEDFDAMFNDDFKTAVANYVKAGGNLYLSKQATRLVTKINRCSWWPREYKNGGYEDGSDIWNMTDNFCANYNRHGHAMIKYVENYSDGWHFPLTSGEGTYKRTNNNNLWDDWNAYGISEGGCDAYQDGDLKGKNIRVHKFETAQNCQILGGFGHTQGMDCAGFIEFFPNGDFKGTVVAMGLAAYQWGTSNTSVYNVKNLTKGILDYLTQTPNLAWNPATVPTSGVIGEDHYMTASATTGYTIRYAADHPEIANIGNTDGRVFYNYFGSTTFHATATGDGWNVPKVTATIASGTITVNGGTEANPRYAYVLPYSLHVMANYDNEEGRRPDYEAAQWFHDQFISGEVQGKHGVYVRPADLASLNPAIKVLWIHNDHVGQTAQSYYNDLGGDTFRGHLAAFLQDGGNVLVTKQATRLVGDLGRNDYPDYANGGYDNFGPWRIANKWNLGGTEIDHSTHAVYANMGTDTWLMAAGRHTNNNDVWSNFDQNYGSDNAQRLMQYEDDHNCKVLGAYGHYNDNNVVSPQIECVGMVEYYPQDNLTLNESSTTYDQKGTIIALGLAAYHWIKDINDTEKTPPLMKNFTRDILYYLNIDEVPSFDWIAEPQNGLAGSEQRIQIELKETALEWTVSDPEKAELLVDPDNASDNDYKILRLKAAGEVTITATRSADGYKIPKNVTGTTQVTKTITVTNAYTRDVTEGAYGTICLPKTAASYTGATMFRIADKTENGIVIEEVNAMEAGKPYIFQATASTINVTYGEGAPVAASSDNGLIGYIGENNLELTANENHYILANDQIWKVNVTVQVPSNRAYVDMNAINATPQAAPRRHISVKNTPTGVDELQETNGAVKQIKDGQLIIIRNEHMFNAQGQMIQ